MAIKATGRDEAVTVAESMTATCDGAASLDAMTELVVVMVQAVEPVVLVE